MYTGMKAFFEARKFQYSEFFRPSLGKKSANKGKIKRWRGKFSPPQCQKTPRRPAEAMFFLLRKIAEYAVKPFQKMKLKVSRFPRASKVSLHCSRPYGLSMRANLYSLTRAHLRVPRLTTTAQTPTLSVSFYRVPYHTPNRPPTAEPRVGGSEPSVRV